MNYRNFYLVFLFLFFSTACSQVETAKNYFWPSSKEESVQKQTNKSIVKDNEVVKTSTDSADVSANPLSKGEEPLPPSEALLPEGQVDSLPVPEPGATPPVFAEGPLPTISQAGSGDSSLPISSIDHFGGQPTSLDVDDRFVYVGFRKKLVIYDPFLIPIHSLMLLGPIQKVVGFHRGQNSTLFVCEEGNIFEIVELMVAQKPRIVKSFEAQGSFEGPFELVDKGLQEGLSPKLVRTLFVHLPDRIQVLDVTNGENINVVGELSFGGEGQLFPYQDVLFVAHGNELTLVDRQTLSAKAQLTLGGPHDILGATSQGLDVVLVLAMRSPVSKRIKGLHLIPLIGQGKGFGGLGHGVEFQFEAKEARLETLKSLVYLNTDVGLEIYDLAKRVLWPKAVFPLTDFQIVKTNAQVAYATTSHSLTRLEWQAVSAMPVAETQDKKSKTNSSKEPVSSNPGLAFKTDENPGSSLYLWQSPKTIPLPAHIDKVLLRGSNTFLLQNRVNNNNAADPPYFYATPTLWEKGQLAPLWLGSPEPVTSNLIRSVKDGFLIYEEKKGKLYYVTLDFSNPRPLDLPAQNVVGFDAIKDGAVDLVYLAVRPRDGKGEIQVYRGEFSKGLKKIATHPMPQVGGIQIFAKGQKMVVACGTEGLCLLDIATERAKPKILYAIPVSGLSANVVDVQITPTEKMALVYELAENNSKISIIDLQSQPPQMISSFANLRLSLEQFRGMTYSAGGFKLLVPTDDGLNVYFVKDPKNPSLLFNWPLGAAFHADVTHRGKTVCVALGNQGVECGMFTGH